MGVFFGLVFVSSNKRKNSIYFPYNVTILISVILWTILITPIVVIAIFRTIKHFTSKKGLKDILNNSKKGLTIYSELSEFEWRHPETIFYRLCEKIKIDTKNAKVLNIPDLMDIYANLIMFTNIFWVTRQETKEEYINRHLKLVKNNPEKLSEEIATYEIGYNERMRSTFEERFDRIVKTGKGNIFEELYLGREFVFLKKEVR
jgi:hypothetical protein